MSRLEDELRRQQQAAAVRQRERDDQAAHRRAEIQAAQAALAAAERELAGDIRRFLDACKRHKLKAAKREGGGSHWLLLPSTAVHSNLDGEAIGANRSGIGVHRKKGTLHWMEWTGSASAGSSIFSGYVDVYGPEAEPQRPWLVGADEIASAMARFLTKNGVSL